MAAIIGVVATVIAMTVRLRRGQSQIAIWCARCSKDLQGGETRSFARRSNGRLGSSPATSTRVKAASCHEAAEHPQLIKCGKES